MRPQVSVGADDRYSSVAVRPDRWLLSRPHPDRAARPASGCGRLLSPRPFFTPAGIGMLAQAVQPGQQFLRFGHIQPSGMRASSPPTPATSSGDSWTYTPASRARDDLRCDQSAPLGDDLGRRRVGRVVGQGDRFGPWLGGRSGPFIVHLQLCHHAGQRYIAGWPVRRPGGLSGFEQARLPGPVW